MKTTISNTDNVIDSRDIIARVEELESERQDLVDALEEAEENQNNNAEGNIDIFDARQEALEALTEWDASEEAEELKILQALAEEGENSPDWPHGETLIHDDYFTQYIEELINDCYEMPKEINSGDWPWRHITIDYEAAAEEAKQDYFSLDFYGETYWIRA